MKSLTKTNPNASLETWNPPDLEAESTGHSNSVRKEKVLAIFQNEDGLKGKEKNSALHQKGIGRNFPAWQPSLLDHQNVLTEKDGWSFIEVTDTPFDKSWTTHAPNGFSENEIPMVLQRTRLQAEEIILAAQAEADAVLLQAQSEIDEQKKNGYQQGWEKASTEIEDTVRAVRNMVEEVEAWKVEFISGSKQILVEMLKDISRKLFGDGAKLDAQALQANLNRIMENAHGLGALKIFLNPNDTKLLDPYWSEQQMLILGEQVKIIASSNVTPGGCLIKGKMGTVDGLVETQLDTILTTFDEPHTLAE